MGNQTLYDSKNSEIKEYEKYYVLNGKLAEKPKDYIEKNQRFIFKIIIDNCKQTCIYQSEIYSLLKNSKKVLISKSEKIRCIDTKSLLIDQFKMDLDVTEESQKFLLLIHRNKNIFPLELNFYDIILNEVKYKLCSQNQPEKINIENLIEFTSIKFDFSVEFDKIIEMNKYIFYYYIKNGDIPIYKSHTLEIIPKNKSKAHLDIGNIPIEYLEPNFEIFFKRVGKEQPFFSKKYTPEEFLKSLNNITENKFGFENIIKFSKTISVMINNYSIKSTMTRTFNPSPNLLNHYYQINDQFNQIKEKKYFTDNTEESSNQILLDKNNEQLKGAYEEPKEKINLTISINNVKQNTIYSISSYHYIKDKKELLKSESIEVKNETNITFPTSIITDYYFEKEQKLTFNLKIIENNNENMFEKKRDEDYLINTTMGCIVGAKNSTYKNSINDNINEDLIIKAEKFNNVDSQIIEIIVDVINEMKLIVLDNLIYFQIFNKTNKIIYQSNLLKNLKNSVKIPCYILNQGFKFVFFKQRCEEFCTFETKIEDLLNEVKFQIFLNPDMYYNINIKGIIYNIPTFLDYINAGVRIGLTIAIDFSSSNGDPNEETSYHCLNIESNRIPVTDVISSLDYEKNIKVKDFVFKQNMIDENNNNIDNMNQNNNIINNNNIIINNNNNNLNQNNNIINNNNIMNNNYSQNINVIIQNDIPNQNEINSSIKINNNNNNNILLENNNLNDIENEYIGNDYEIAIKSCGDIVAYYDYEQLFPVYGFNAENKSQNLPKLEQCFPINFNKDNPKINKISGVLKEYRKCLEKINLADSSTLAPVFKHIFSSNNIDKNNIIDYKILMILTDGIISDMNDTIEEIKKCVSLPLSIIIIGIGFANFKNMEKLDDDIETDRDIVKFVPFNKYKGDPSLLAKQVLEEIPKQIVGFYKQNKKKPEDIKKYIKL